MVQENVAIAIIIIVLFILLSGIAALIWSIKNEVGRFAKKEQITDEESDPW